MSRVKMIKYRNALDCKSGGAFEGFEHLRSGR